MNDIYMGTAWVIRNSNGRYVNYLHPNATKGSSFTTHPLGAKRFPSQERAQADCCGNEIAIPLSSLIK